jgi:alpha-1,3-mannosyltransferase
LFKRYVIGNIVFLSRALATSFQPLKNENGKPRILHVVRQYHPAIGGLESYVSNMVKHQSAAGYHCEVLTLNKVFHGYEGKLQAEETIDGIPVKRVKFFGKRRFFLPLISPFFFRRFDAVHVHNTDMFFDYGAICAAITRVPFFATTHGGFFHTKDFSLIKKVYFQTVTRFSCLFYRHIFAISQNDYDTFKPLKKTITLLHNAIEPLGSDISKGTDFLFIGRLAENKRVDLAIKVFAALKKHHGIQGQFHIIGPAWDVTIENLQGVALREDVPNEVVFHGAADHHQMRDIAGKCGYFLSSSSFEGFGMSMLEAMSVGLIPFVQNNEAFAELVGKSGTGVCVDMIQTETAAKEIADNLKTVTDATRQQAYSFARRFSWDGLTEDTLAVYGLKK